MLTLTVHDKGWVKIVCRNGDALWVHVTDLRTGAENGKKQCKLSFDDDEHNFMIVREDLVNREREGD